MGTRRTKGHFWRLALVIGIACAIDLAASRLLDRQTGSRGLRLLYALMPLPGDLVIIAMVMAAIRRLDDFQKRVHFEAVTMAFLSTGVALFIDSFLQKARLVGPFNPASAWVFMLVFYGLGYLVAIRRYR